jgi:hypothetical protein
VTDDLFYARRRQLEDAVKKAVQELLAHESIPPAAFYLSLDENMTVTIGPESLVDDRDRLNAIGRLQMNIGPGESFQEDVPWVASFATDGPDGYVHVFAGATLREAIDKAIAATGKADDPKAS